MYKDKDLCLLLKIGNKYGRKLFNKRIDVGKKMSNKYGRKILGKSMDAAKDFAKIAGKKCELKVQKQLVI